MVGEVRRERNPPVRSACLLVSSIVVAGPVAAASALPATEVIALLNTERQTHGIPGTIVENLAWSADCARHNAYQRANGLLDHPELPWLTGYSEAGNEAGRASALSTGSGWKNGNPFAHSPIHLMQLLAPQLSETGVAENDDRVCMWTWPGYKRRFNADTVYTAPGDGGGVPVAETAHEQPFVPGDFVGLPRGTVTGPHLYVFAVGPSATAMRVQRATLTAASGPSVEIRTVDNTTPRLGTFLPSGAILIPVAPLAPATDYVASVSLASTAGVIFDRTWWLRTAPSGRATTGVLRGGPGQVGATASDVGPRGASPPARRAVAASAMPGWPPVATVSTVTGGWVGVRLRVPPDLVGQLIRITLRGRCRSGRRAVIVRPVGVATRQVLPRACATRRGSIVASRRGILRLTGGRAFAPFVAIIGRT
jgi:hypothetical protein